MPANSKTLFDMIGDVRQIKRNAPAEFVTNRLNSRVRELIDARAYWADLSEMRILSVPDSYQTGTASLATGVATVTGVGTAWPVSDIVSSTLPDGVTSTGYVRVYPLSMIGITEASMLYVDTGGVPEVVAVMEIASDSFVASFQYTHNPNCTITQSSLVGRQFKVANEPVFDIRAVTSTTQLILESAWGAEVMTTQAYSIFKSYFNLGSDVRMIHIVLDTRTGRPLARDVTQDHLALRDPQRTIDGDPTALIDFQVGANGAMLYELWPRATAARQVQVFLSKQWPEMRQRNDRPPPFLNPQIFIDGATADALRQKVDIDDPYFNPPLAREFDAKFVRGFGLAVNADSARHMRDLQTRASSMVGDFGGNWAQTHLVCGAEEDLLAW